MAVGAQRPHERKLARKLFPGLVRKISDVAEGKFVEEDPPRAYSEFPFDLDQEFRGAITAAEEYAPEGKRGTLYLWSGGAEPFEGAIARTRRLGLRNLNGGDLRFDADYPSISYLSAISRVARSGTPDLCRQRQRLHLHDRRRRPRSRFPAPRSDDQIHRGAATAQADQRLLPHVRRRKDRPARGRPVSSRCRPAGARDAGRGVALRGDRGRVFRHCNSRHSANSPGCVQNCGALQTVRFDDVADLSVDFARSIGVIGQQRKGSSLYVALDEAREDVIARARTRDRPPHTGTAVPLSDRRPLGVSRACERRDCGFSVMAQAATAPGQMNWGGLPPGQLSDHGASSSITISHGRTWRRSAPTASLALTVDADAVSNPVTIEVTCLGPGGRRC